MWRWWEGFGGGRVVVEVGGWDVEVVGGFWWRWRVGCGGGGRVVVEVVGGCGGGGRVGCEKGGRVREEITWSSVSSPLLVALSILSTMDFIIKFVVLRSRG